MQLNGGNNQPSYFHINDATNSNGGNEAVGTHMLTLHQEAKGSTTWEINGADQTVTLSKSTWYTFKLSKSGSLLYLTVTPTAGGDPVFAQQAITVNSTKGGLGNMIFQTKRYYSFMAIDNVVLRTLEDGDVPKGTPTSYTIQYRNESDVKIADDVIVNGLVDDEVSASEAQTEAKVYNEQKYIYKSGNNPITLVENAASNVITLVYREAETYTYKVASSLGTEIANSSDFEGNTVYVPYPKYELNAGSLYEAPQSSDWYRKSYKLTANVDETITYSKSSISDVVYYEEGENITGATATSAGANMGIRSSNAQCGYTSSDLTLINLPAGNYVISGVMYSNSSGGLTLKFLLGDEAYNPNVVGSSNWATFSKNFTLATAADVKWLTSGGSKDGLDYVYIQRIPESVPATIGEHGYATFSSTYALDFTSAGVEAYIATGGNETTVTMQKVEGTVAANTGLVLKGAKGSYNIPVVTTGTSHNDNKLWAITNGQTVKKADEGYTNYVLAWQNSKVVFAPVGDKSADLPAGSAALSLQNIGSARAINLVFGGITGINEAAASAEAAQKDGKFVINGQLVIKKNGKMFNAAGAQMK